MKDLIESLNRAHELDESSGGEHNKESILAAFNQLESDLNELSDYCGFDFDFYASPDCEEATEEYVGTDAIINVEIKCPALGDYPPNYTEIFDVTVLEPGSSEFDFDLETAKETLDELLDGDEEYDDVDESITRKNDSLSKQDVQEDFDQVRSYPYKYIPDDYNDWDYEGVNLTEDEFYDAWDSGTFPDKMWLTSEAVVTKEGRWYQVSWGGNDDYREFSNIADCKDCVEGQYEYFQWLKKSPRKK